MLKKLFKNTSENKRVGVEITASQVNIIAIDHTQTHFEIVDQAEYTIDQLEQAVFKIKKDFTRYNCHLALPSRYMMLKNLTFSDCLNENEIITLLKFNSEEYFGSPENMMCFDLEFVDESTKKIRVLASKKDYIQNWWRVFSDAGISLKKISLNILAIENFLKYYAVLDLSKTYAMFVLQGNELVQTLIVDGRVIQINGLLLISLSVELIAQEVKNFFRLLHTKKTFRDPIENLILIGFEFSVASFLQEKITKSCILETDLIAKTQVQINNLISFGMILPC